MRHFPATAAEPRRGGKQHVLALAELVSHERLIKPHRPQIPVLPLPLGRRSAVAGEGWGEGAHQNADDTFAESAAAGVDFYDFSTDRLYMPLFESVDFAAV